jgi:hypothetical protein
MSELWGFQSGQSQRQADDQLQGLYNLRMAEGSIDLKTKQLTYDNAKLMQTRQEAAIKMMQTATTHQGAGTSENPTEGITSTLFDMARIDFQAGLPEQGLAAVKSAASLQANHAKIVQETGAAEMRRLTYMSNLLTDVNSQAGWDQSKMIYNANFPDNPIPPELAKLPYSPELVKSLASGTQTALQKANQKLSEARAAEVKTTNELQEIRKPWVQSQTRLNNDRADALEKNGGGNALPKPRVVSDIEALIQQDYPDIEKPDLKTMANRVAMDADKYVREDHMDPLQAQHKAVAKAKESGLFFGLRPGRTRAGESRKNPLAVPMKDGKIDINSMSDNKIYNGADLGHPGELYIFDKSLGGLSRITTEGDEDEDDK